MTSTAVSTSSFVVLEDENGNVQSFAFLELVSVDGVPYAVLLPLDWAQEKPPCAVIRVADPNHACMAAAELFAPPAPVRAPGVHPTAIVDPSVRLGAGVHVGALTVVEKGAELRRRKVVQPGGLDDLVADLRDAAHDGGEVVLGLGILAEGVELESDGFHGGDGSEVVDGSDGLDGRDSSRLREGSHAGPHFAPARDADYSVARNGSV